MALAEAVNHLDPIEHLKDVKPYVLEMTSDARQQDGHAFDHDLVRANGSLMLELVAEAQKRYPDDPAAREAYVSGAQVGMNFMREVWAAQNLAEIVPFDTVVEVEPIPLDDSVASGLLLANEPLSGQPATELFQD